MTNFYAKLVLSHRLWFYRLSVVNLDRFGSDVAFTALQVLNIFSLLILLPMKSIPAWLFVSFPFVFGVCINWVVNRIYRAHPIAPVYGKLNDDIPKFREFPLVYTYQLFTLVLFIACLSLATHHAA